jgi:Bifunctional DNA primase/polymerase, N-terminal
VRRASEAPCTREIADTVRGLWPLREGRPTGPISSRSRGGFARRRTSPCQTFIEKHYGFVRRESRWSRSGAMGVRLPPDGSFRGPLVGDRNPPRPTWKPYQMCLPTEAEVFRWIVVGGAGLAVVAGDVSGGLEAVDIDDPSVVAPYCALVAELCPGLIERLPSVQTPSNGRHIYYRCDVSAGNQKLAWRLDKGGTPVVSIEMRGEGGYVIVPPSPPDCHPLKRPYRVLRGDLGSIPVLSVAERCLLLNAARSFNAYAPPERLVTPPRVSRPRLATGTDDTRPGDAYNAEADWCELLEAHGWKAVRQRHGVIYWQRPGKSEPGWSATTNYGGMGCSMSFRQAPILLPPIPAIHSLRLMRCWSTAGISPRRQGL